MQIRSNLLGYVLLATSGTYAASDELCDRGNDFIVPLIKQGLDGHNMSNLLCGREGRRQGIMEVVDMMMELRTKLFVNIIENVSDRTGWMGWLCDNLAAEALSVPGLYGSRATGAVCWDASPSEGLWGYCGKGPLDSECNEVVDGTGLVRKT